MATAAGFRWPAAADTLDAMNLPIHEAGHTLVGLALGRRLNYVSIEDGDQISDFEALTGTDRASVELWIKTALGGPLAEQQTFGVSWGCKVDVAGIRHEVATNLPEEEELGFVTRMAAEVSEVLGLHGDALAALATELLVRKRLDGADVARILAGAETTQATESVARRGEEKEMKNL